jgi:glycosyltransferase involved in cell wall biosynthesis
MVETARTEYPDAVSARRGPPAISIVMPVHNQAETLHPALASVRAQSERDWELLAIDDGSTDGSLDVLRAHARGDPRIRVETGPHRGLVAALNRGLSQARGHLIARMDADDVCLPERLAVQRGHLDADPAVGLVAARVRFGGDPVRGAGYARYVDWTNRFLSHEAIALARFAESPLAHPSVMFRRELPERLGGYAPGDFPEDYELWLRWLEGGVRMEKRPEVLLVWNDSPGRLSRRDSRYAVDAFHRVKARYLMRWLAAHNAHHPRVILWGAGRVTRRRVRPLLELGLQVTSYVDVDPRKVGRTIHGRPVADPASLPAPGAGFLVSCVSSAGARDHIEGALTAAGYRAGHDYVLAA